MLRRSTPSIFRARPLWVASIVLFTALFSGVTFLYVHAAMLSYVSDLITESAPSTNANHTLIFTATFTIPPSGRIIITPDDGAFSIPAGFDYIDIDLAVGSGGPLVERNLAPVADAVNDGVSVVTGTSGSITFTLNSSQGISVGSNVRILLGTNASFGAAGSHAITNPTPVRSYHINIATKDTLDTMLAETSAMIAVVAPIGLSVSAPVVAPILSNGLPSGLIEAGNRTIEISFNTGANATCRYATTTGIAYALMPGTFSPTVGTFFSKVFTGFVDDTTYSYYVRCKGHNNTVNTDDYVISFTLKPTPSTNTSIVNPGEITTGLPGNLGNGGAGDFPNGSASLFVASITLNGFAIPQSTVSILRDGKSAGTTQAKADGAFTFTIKNLERGAYTFGTYDTDSRGRPSIPYSATMTLDSGTKNDISNIVISPTIALSQSAINTGDSLTILGESIPNARIEVTEDAQSSTKGTAGLHTFTASSSASGSWQLPFDTSTLQNGTYIFRVRAIQSNTNKSEYSDFVLLGVGGTANVVTKGFGDLNHDGKINLVDFSILLSKWNTEDGEADLSSNGTVDLADVSIMLFHWTG